MMGESEYARVALDELETWHLEKLAERWGVVIDPDLYGDYYTGFSKRHSILDWMGQQKARKIIRKGRREEIRYWVGIIAQVIGMLTGLVGVSIGLLAFLYKK